MLILSLLIMALLISTFVTNAIVAKIPFDVMASLESLFLSTNGMNWDWLSEPEAGAPWNFTRDSQSQYVFSACDNWQGICCASEMIIPTSKCLEIATYLNISHPRKFIPGKTDDYIAAVALLSMNMDGTLPQDFFNISTMEYLRINYNELLTGTLPSSITCLVNVTCIDLTFNDISGTIPSLDGLASLQVLNLYYNNLEGSIPPLTRVTTLTEIYLYNNRLEGVIPPLTGLSSLKIVYLSYNLIQGTIPNLAGLPNLVEFIVAGNLLDGTIPLLVNLPSLKELYLNINHLEGTIPSLSELTSLEQVFFNGNNFEGTIPSLQGLMALQYFYVNYNNMIGTIPPISNLPSLQEVFLLGNYFTGNLPIITAVPSLMYLEFSNNLLEGTFPSFLDANSLKFLLLDNNMFSSELPLFNLFPASLEYLYLNDNQFTGPIPSSVSSMNSLSFLNLQDNILTGRLPTELKLLTSLNSLLVHDNQLTGSPTLCFSQSLVDIDISINSFTGFIPTEIFALPNISHVSMVQNCFSGSISDVICNSSATLLSLALDGLTSGSGCQLPLFWGITDTFLVENFMQSSIPSCLFTMSRLRSLGLAGNGLTGSLPDMETSISKSLLNFSISNNQISGTIPESFQSQSWEMLDLSYNMFSGTIGGLDTFYENTIKHNESHKLASNASIGSKVLGLQVNRLSGQIPSQYLTAADITVVTGNLFDCAKTSQLPMNDPGSPHTECGSYDLNAGLGLWLALLIFLALCLLLGFAYHSTWLTCKASNDSIINRACLCWKESRDLHDNDSLAVTSCAFGWMRNISKHLLFWTLCALLLYLPVELALKYINNREYSTHTFQYAYGPSLAFVVGEVVAGVILCLTLVVMATAWLFLSRSQSASRQKTVDSLGNANSTSSVTSTSFLARLHAYTWFSGVVLIDAIGMLSVNSGYIAIALYYNQTYASLAVVALVTVKMTWNIRIMPVVMRFVESRVSYQPVSTGTMMSWLILLNNVLVPIIATMCTQPLCFYNIFVPAQDITAFVQYTVPDVGPLSSGTVILLVPQIEQLSYKPPFTYSFQCSSSLITYYVPMYVVMYIYLGFVSPIVCVAITALHNYTDATTSSSSSSSSTWLAYLMNAIGCDIMRKPSQHLLHDHTMSSSSEDYSSNILTSKNRNSDSSLLNFKNIAAVMTCHLTTMLTFGLAYPLLSVLICFAGCVEIVQWRLLVGRYLMFCGNKDTVCDDDKRATMISRLERSCAGVGDMLHQSRWLLLVAMSLFFSLFLLDMAGDRARDSWRRSLWAPLTILLWPVMLALCEGAITLCHLDHNCCLPMDRKNSHMSDRGVGLLEQLGWTSARSKHAAKEHILHEQILTEN